MKKGINIWAFPEQTSLANAFRLISDAGFEGVELNLEAAVASDSENEVLPPQLNSQKEDIKKIVALAHQHGLQLTSLSTALLWDYPLTSDDGGEREKGKQIVRKMIDVAGWMGVDTVLVVPGAVDVPWKPAFKTVHYEQAYQRSLAALKELAVDAGQKKITIAIENVWNKFLLSPLEFRSFIDAIDSDYVGAYFDVGNILLTGYPEQWIEILGNRIKRVHLKDFRKINGGMGLMVGLLQGDVNWPRVIQALRGIGYQSYLTAELFPYKFQNERLIQETAQAIESLLKL